MLIHTRHNWIKLPFDTYTKYSRADVHVNAMYIQAFVDAFTLRKNKGTKTRTTNTQVHTNTSTLKNLRHAQSCLHYATILTGLLLTLPLGTALRGSSVSYSQNPVVDLDGSW